MGDCLFLNEGVSEGTASKKYCEQVVGMVQPHLDTIKNHMNAEKFNPYGTRKGLATYAVSGMTMPPSIPSIAWHGEWSIGSVLDLYWHFGSVGDQYLGQILAGLDPMSPDFDVLPPHWNMADPISNEFMQHGMRMTYSDLMEKHPSKIALILCLFACIVFHADKLIQQMMHCPGHDFTKLAILHDRDLLKELKALVTLDPTPGGIDARTGIPPHVMHAHLLTKLVEQMGTLIANMETQNKDLVAAMVQTLEDNAFEAGHITSQRLMEILDDHKEAQMEATRGELKSIKASINSLKYDRRAGADDDSYDDFAMGNDDDEARQGGANGSTTNTYQYGGKFHAVPEGFEFPKATLQQGL